MVRKNKKKIFFLAGAALIACAVVFLLEQRNVTHIFTKKQQNVESAAKTTSTSETAQPNYAAGNTREPGNSMSEHKGSGVITDTGGTISAGTDTSNPTTSSTGQITTYVPTKNSTISSGAQVAGTSSLGKVYYRLIDDVSGEIASGELTVKDSKFSGTLTFRTSASSGRLDIYGMRSDGTEFSNVEIPLLFNQ